jgi:hypothetical protein
MIVADRWTATVAQGAQCIEIGAISWVSLADAMFSFNGARLDSGAAIRASTLGSRRSLAVQTGTATDNKIGERVHFAGKAGALATVTSTGKRPRARRRGAAW